MAKYQKYAEYKDSGIDWLGEIPNHWAMSKLRYLFNFSKGLSITKENLQDEGIPCVNYGEVHSKYGFEVNPKKHPLKCVNASYLKTSENALLNNGDFVFADTSEDLKGSGNFTHLLGDEQIFAGYHTVIARPYNASASRFYAYLFDSKEFRSQIQLAVKGVKVFSITQAILRSADAWLPSTDEQVKIANFLDHETTQIDTLIAKQEKLIELLKEKRQAVISHAVTKGLNPNVSMKDSGVEWLGKVPEHWEVRQLRYLGSCQNGINIGAEYFGSGSPFISYGDVYRNPELPSVFEGLVQSTENDKRIYSVQRGDVLFTRTSETIEEIGFSSTCLTDVKDATFAGFLIRFRPIQNTLLPEYSKFYFRNILLRAFFVKEMNLVTRASLSQELLKKLAVPFSSLEEQKQIADFLSAKERVFDKLVNDCIKQIELLKERRTALISSAVTGKINVSNWQHPNEAKTELSL